MPTSRIHHNLGASMNAVSKTDCALLYTVSEAVHRRGISKTIYPRDQLSFVCVIARFFVFGPWEQVSVENQVCTSSCYKSIQAVCTAHFGPPHLLERLRSRLMIQGRGRGGGGWVLMIYYATAVRRRPHTPNMQGRSNMPGSCCPDCVSRE